MPGAILSTWYILSPSALLTAHMLSAVIALFTDEEMEYGEGTSLAPDDCGRNLGWLPQLHVYSKSNLNKDH